MRLREPLLTAAMIVRDEAHHLPDCLGSIRHIVDEIVIVDTGSTDDTVAIARSYGARVEIHPWQQDFATPRNIGLDLARGRWILYIDADERVRPLDVPAFRARLDQAEELALRVLLKLSSTVTPAWEYRLWRSDPRIRFRGLMHEKVTPALAEVSAADRLRIADSELFLDHVGYDGDQLHKHRRNLPLLQAELAVDPSNPYNWNYLSQALEALDSVEEAEAALERGIALTREKPSIAGAKLWLRQLQRHLLQERDITEELEEAVGQYPDSFGLAWIKILADMRAGRYEQALERVERFDADPEMPVEEGLSYPVELFAARAVEARALCLFRLGRYRASSAAFRELERVEPEQPQHRLKRLLAEHRDATAGGAGNGCGDLTGRRWPARQLLRGLTIDIGGVPARLSASDLSRAVAMRALLGRLPASGQEPVVSIHFSAHPEPFPERDRDGEHGGLSVWQEPDLFLARPGVTGHVDGSHGALGVLHRDLGLVFRVAGPPLLGRLLAPHGVHLLHAGAIEREGGALLILGGSGSGKSTAVLGAAHQGWGVLSDDLVLLRLGPRGPEAHGLPKRLAVPPELVSEPGRLSRLQADRRERVELSFDNWVHGWHPVAGVALVDHGTAQVAETEILARDSLLGALVSSLVSRYPDDIRAFKRLAIRLSPAPAFRLLHAFAPENRLSSLAAVLAAQTPGTTGLGDETRVRGVQ